MKALKLLTLTSFFAIITLTSFAQNNNPIFSTFENGNEGDETTLSAIMLEQEKVMIQWQSEMKGVYFEIEKSKDGENFEMIATSEEVTTSQDGTAFIYVDETPSIENYYRIFYITPSGNVDYSEVTFISPLPSNMTLDGLR